MKSPRAKSAVQIQCFTSPQFKPVGTITKKETGIGPFSQISKMSCVCRSCIFDIYNNCVVAFSR